MQIIGFIKLINKSMTKWFSFKFINLNFNLRPYIYGEHHWIIKFMYKVYDIERGLHLDGILIILKPIFSWFYIKFANCLTELMRNFLFNTICIWIEAVVTPFKLNIYALSDYIADKYSRVCRQHHNIYSPIF